MSYMLQPGIILLKEGTDTSQGTGHLISNINACEAISNIIRTTLGPCGMDKLIYNKDTTTISNDGATVIKLLDIAHPAAKTLVDIAKSQDEEVGDGTTSVVILAGEFLSAAKSFIEEGIHPQVIIRAYRKACALAKERIKQLAVNVLPEDKDKMHEVLKRCASTSLNSKLIGTHCEFFSDIVVKAVSKLDDKALGLEAIGVKKEPGGSLVDSIFIEGVAFKKTFSYAGFEQQPKKILNPKILCLNVELELKNEKTNAEIHITHPKEYQSFVDAEWNIIYDKLQKCVDTGAQVILSRLPIGDLATQFFADRDLFCAGRVTSEDLVRVCKATGAKMQTTTNGMTPNVLGLCGEFEERQVGAQRYNFFTGCKGTKTATVILRGGGEHFIDEAERSLHDAIMIVRRVMKHPEVVAGGGAIDMEISKYLNEHSKTIGGKEQLIIKGFAKAFEAIPRQLLHNAGFDANDLLNLLRKKHSLPDNKGKWFGVDLLNEDIFDAYANYVWEPALVKLNSIEAATEAACVILSVDETVKNPKSDGKIPDDEMPAGMGRQF
eukprot:TRINITY_DN133_c1_g1_i1.p1 TRINITY_DN133_c1_g1~~TRINITY_DN133_c1_g1_i1.p1  ORF type:complete len:549 (+),score=127.57 TRINITY_DN133_c1_g1_i1:96-1742(+)